MRDRTESPDQNVDASNDKRRFRVRHLVAVAVVSAVIAAGIGPAFAWTATFDDVPFDHPFEQEIAWMGYTGISTGWPGSGPVGQDYRPNEPVTRQAMAAFMERLYNLDGERRYASATDYTSTSSTVLTSIPDATVDVEIPEGVLVNLHVTFSAESTCHGGGAISGYCVVQIFVDPPGPTGPTLLGPDDGGVAFDSTSNGAEPGGSWESHSIDRYDDFVSGAGTYQITAKMRVVGAGVSFNIDDWVLTAETDLEPTDYIS